MIVRIREEEPAGREATRALNDAACGGVGHVLFSALEVDGRELRA